MNWFQRIKRMRAMLVNQLRQQPSSRQNATASLSKMSGILTERIHDRLTVYIDVSAPRTHSVVYAPLLDTSPKTLHEAPGNTLPHFLLNRLMNLGITRERPIINLYLGEWT